MHYEVVLIPALAGYWIIKNIYLFNDPFAGKSNQQVLFESALIGGVLLASSWVFVRALEEIFESGGPLQYVDLLWRNGATPEYASVLIVTVLFAIVSRIYGNIKISKEEANYYWAIMNEKASARILRESFEKSILAEVLMENGDSYIGFPEADPTTMSYEGDVTFVPSFYGQRDPNNNHLNITAKCSEIAAENRVVLKMDKIMLIRLFVPENNTINWFN